MKKNSNSKDSEMMKGLSEEEINSPEFDPDEFAPAPDTDVVKEENDKEKNKFNALFFAFVAAVMALIVGLLGWAASDNISAFSQKKLEKTILTMYENGNKTVKYDTADNEVYLVLTKDKCCGYVVKSSVDGFSGKIHLLVAFDTNNNVSKVKVIGHNESPGLGSKIAKDDFLSQFENAVFGSLNFEYDMISGATTSSEAVANGIKAVAMLGLNAESMAKSHGYTCVANNQQSTESDKDKNEAADTTAPVDTDSINKAEKPDDTKEETTAADTEKIGPDAFIGGSNGNPYSSDMGISGGQETTVYVTEGEEPETTIPEEGVEETTETEGKSE